LIASGGFTARLKAFPSHKIRKRRPKWFVSGNKFTRADENTDKSGL
jgi:hypothetical protein